MKRLHVSTKLTRLNISGNNLDFYIVDNVEELITDPADEDKIPLWAEIWPAAQGLSRYIMERVDFSGCSVLDLGTGVGLTGVAGGLKGARVTFSDYHPEALEVARINADLHGLQDPRFHLGDWRNFNIGYKFDCIIGSDIIYDPKFFNYLIAIVRDCLKEGGRVIFSHPARKLSFSFIEEFNRAGNWQETHSELPVAIPDSCLPNYEVHIHDMRQVSGDRSQ